MLTAKRESSVQMDARSHLVLTVIVAFIAIFASAAAIYLWRLQQSAAIQLSLARAEANHAEQNLNTAKGAIDAIVSDLADKLANPKGIQNSAIAPLLASIEDRVGALVTKTGNNPELRRSEGAMYVQFSATYLALGNTALAVASAKKGSDIFRALAATEPDNDDIQSDVGLSLARLAEALRASGDLRGGLSADRESLEISRMLFSKDPTNRQFQTDVVIALWRLASAGDDPRARLTEALKMLKNLKLAAMLNPTQEEWIGRIEEELSQLP